MRNKRAKNEVYYAAFIFAVVWALTILVTFEAKAGTGDPMEFSCHSLRPPLVTVEFTQPPAIFVKHNAKNDLYVAEYIHNGLLFGRTIRRHEIISHFMPMDCDLYVQARQLVMEKIQLYGELAKSDERKGK